MWPKDKTGGKGVIEAGARNTKGLEGIRATPPRGSERRQEPPAPPEARASDAAPAENSPTVSPLGRAAEKPAQAGEWPQYATPTGGGGKPPAAPPGMHSGTPPAAPGGPDTAPFFARDWTPMLRFEGDGGTYFSYLFITFLLSLLTLGVYSFWGRTEQRRYLWSKTFLFGEPLEYTGTGKELFISFLIVVPAFLLIMFLSGLAATAFGQFGPMLLYLPLIFIWQFASYRALRFRLTRTRWRGIRGNLGGSAVSYARKATGYIILIMLSLGLLYPWASGRLAALKLDNVWFGNRKLSFSGPVKELYKSFLAGILLTILAAALFFGLSVLCMVLLDAPSDAYTFYDDYPYQGYQSWYLVRALIPLFVMLATLFMFVIFTSFYRAAFFRWLFKHARFGGLNTRSTLRGGQLLRLTVGNAFITLFTLGLGTAWCIIRSARVRINSAEYRGEPQLEALLQDTREAPKTGEGMLGALDVDIAF